MPRRLGLRAGDVLRPPHKPGQWRIARLTIEKMVVTAEVVRLPPAAAATAGAAAGRPVSQPDLAAGATTLVLLDLPGLADAPAERPQLLIAAAGSEGWRAAPLSASFDGGASWQAAGSTAAGAVLGHVVGAPGPSGTALFDLQASIEVELLNEAMWLEGRSDAALAGGANLAVVGDELLQFGAAEPLGARRFRLSRLLRGRRGTEWATAGHGPGELFVMIEAGALAVVEPPLSALAGAVLVQVHGIGDPADAPPAARSFEGESLRPGARPSHRGAAGGRRDSAVLGAAEPERLALAERQRDTAGGGAGGLPDDARKHGRRPHARARRGRLHLRRGGAGGGRGGAAADGARRAAWHLGPVPRGGADHFLKGVET